MAKKKTKSEPNVAPLTVAPPDRPYAKSLGDLLSEKWAGIIVEQKPPQITLVELKLFFDTLQITGLIPVAVRRASWPEPLVQRWLDQGKQEFYGGDWETWAAAFFRKTQQIIADVVVYTSSNLLSHTKGDAKACATFLRLAFPELYILPGMRPVASIGPVGPAVTPGAAAAALPAEVSEVLRAINPGDVQEIRKLHKMYALPAPEDVIDGV